ncbi:MAG: phosphate transport system substrate-binding protein [Thermoleophilaceae bacterium]|nr:phosphate transport system substrate-binding protein [Thermoleophilaceae bacterium]
MKSRKWLAVAASAAVALPVAACGSSNSDSTSGGGASNASSSAPKITAPSGSINGAGSTFAAPIYQQWGNELKGQGITVDYQGVGSGAGVAQFQTGTADFGASDPALTPDDRKAAKKGEAVQVPTAFGAITVSYNVSGVDKGLKLDGATVADIFLGKVTKWNDPAIATQNPGVKLPGNDITVVHRSDESGTTKGFTTFLAAYSPEWKSKVGVDKTVKWPTGTGAKGNDGVAAAVKQQQNSVGYVEEAYALQNNFSTADVKNKAGQYVEPTLASTTAAGDGVKVPADLGISIIDAPGKQAYPISSQTFVVVYKDMCKAGLDKGTAQRVGAFLDYGLSAGQDVLGQLQYAKLPDAIKSKAQAAVDSLQCNGAPLK